MDNEGALHVGPEVVQHPSGTLESNYTISRVHERLTDRHAVTAADVQNE